MLIATMAMGPLLSLTDSGGRVLNVTLGLVLLMTTLMPMQDETSRRAFMVVVVVAIVIGLAPIRTGLGETGPLTLGLWSAIALFAAARELNYAVSSRSVDMHHLMAALNAYLLVGIFLGAIWLAMEEAMPGSLLQGGQPIPALTLPDGIYFSFVTLATLGYGDITPVTPLARGLATFEAVFGQLYLAVMVARIVSLRIAAEESNDAQ
ncbi:MAG: two pore domain potassium channel family protein [Lysobacter sp.]|nr:two pore domain potassium channel family protein [Lysobacter sp.]